LTDSDLIAKAQKYIDDHERKANTQEHRARAATVILTTSTAAIPVLILASTEGSRFLLGELLPSVLAGIGALVAALVHIDKPTERWMLYRRAQRLWEAELLLFEHGEGLYADNDADQHFVRWMADQRIATHDSWATLVPTSASVAQLAKPDG
jgi:hypothetical protein